MLPGLEETRLTTLPVTGQGRWSTGAHRQWSGEACADQPLVALVLCDNQTVSWAKTQRPRSDGTLTVQLLMKRFDRYGRDVQVNFGIGGYHARARMLVPTAEYKPKSPDRFEAQTARVEKMLTIEGDPEVDFYAVFICMADVEFSETGTWTLKSEFAGDIPEPYRSVFRGGRFGAFDLDDDADETKPVPSVAGALG